MTSTSKICPGKHHLSAVIHSFKVHFKNAQIKSVKWETFRHWLVTRDYKPLEKQNRLRAFSVCNAGFFLTMREWTVFPLNYQSFKQPVVDLGVTLALLLYTKWKRSLSALEHQTVSHTTSKASSSFLGFKMDSYPILETIIYPPAHKRSSIRRSIWRKKTHSHTDHSINPEAQSFPGIFHSCVWCSHILLPRLWWDPEQYVTVEHKRPLKASSRC